MNTKNTETPNNGNRNTSENSAFDDAIRLAITSLDAATIYFKKGNEFAGNNRVYGANGVLEAVQALTGREICLVWGDFDRTAYSLVENKFQHNETTIYSYEASDHVKRQAGFREQAEKVANDFLNKEQEFIKSNNLSPSDFRSFQICLDEYARKGETRAYTSNVAKLFKKYGFSIGFDENRVHYVIKADSAQNNAIDTDGKNFIQNVPHTLNQKVREMGCQWDSREKCWFHADPAKAKEIERLANAEREKSPNRDGASTIQSKVTHEM